LRLLPNTLLVFNGPFIKVLKEDNGLNLIRNFPSCLFEQVVKIFALIYARSYEDLVKFIAALRDIFVENMDLLNLKAIRYLLDGIGRELELRNP
jgi:hypothetical protein